MRRPSRSPCAVRSTATPPGQSQKEYFVNQAHVLSDFLHHRAVLAEAGTPPADPVDGELWLVASGATGEWGMHDGELAGWNGSEWLFIAPHEGMQVFDRAAGQLRLYRGGWHSPLPPAQVNGGAAPDIELRAAFTSLVEALGEAGIFPVTQ
ncbi:MAG: DUF2793 domain-containing protein [Sphingomonadaceae bacterium]|nr:DUF2793 domain-containing protein [Sphingomonadaceae bacterium]MCP5384102.1 DUF2793 domain-containing protein [Altererythrobacter sp.]MCP5393016.1 DUF2793 domain-containing protein [Sphingomonadaceae bacterium]